MLIDVHVHHSPRAYTDAMARYAGVSRSPGWSAQPHTDSPEDVARRLELMDEAGVDLQVQSHGIMNPYLRSEHEAIEAARACNDGYADLAARYPNRFAALVSLPLPHVDGALRELERGMDDLGMAGVGMNCFVFERSTAEGEFEPLCAELDRRRAM